MIAGIVAAPPAGSIHQLALLYAPQVLRPALQSLLGVRNEIRASLRAGLDHTVAHARLAWWQAECERALAGTSGHPLMRVIDGAARSAGAAIPDLRGLVQAAAMDLAQAPLEDAVTLEIYCDAALGTLFAAFARLLGADASAARGVGTALHALEWHTAAATTPVDMVAAESALVGRLQALAPVQRTALRPLLVWVALARWRMARALPQPADTPLTTLRLTMLQNLQAWRAARSALQGRFLDPPPNGTIA